MIQAIILIPALVAMAMLNNTSAARVAMKVYVPCMMIVPMYVQFQLGGFFVNPTSFVSLLLALVGFYVWYGTVKLTLLDLCVVIDVCSVFYADLHRHDMRLAMYAALLIAMKALFPYMIGRTLIEQTGMRKQFAMTFVACLAVIAVASTWEYLTVTNLFQKYAERLIQHSSGWGRQTRWGFSRIAGPYGHAITAGMIFTIGVLLQLWLVGTKSWESSNFFRFIRSRRKALYVTMTMAIGLFMTQSRGPWIGCGFGLIVASIGFSRDRRRAAVLALTSLTIAVAVTSVALNQYTSVDETKTTDRDQLNASYRRDLISTYMPLIDQGGMWGWGTPSTIGHDGSIGYSKNQTSIDNEYLRVAMWQGYFGGFLFVFMEALAIWHLIKLCMTLRNRDDILFAYCMLGLLIATAFSLTTVYLGDPMFEIVYLFLGWAMSIRPTRARDEAPLQVSRARFAFQRVFA